MRRYSTAGAFIRYLCFYCASRLIYDSVRNRWRRRPVCDAAHPAAAILGALFGFSFVALVIFMLTH